MLKELHLPIVSMFTTYVVVAFDLTEDNYNQIFYTSIDVHKCGDIVEEINKAHKKINNDFRVRFLSLRFYLEEVFKKGFAIGRHTTKELEDIL